MDSGSIGIIEEIWRYPVSSLGGEPLPSAQLDGNGIPGDRTWCLVDSETHKPATPETDPRWRAALFLRSRLGDVVPEIGFPDGEWLATTDERLPSRLEGHFGFQVQARRYGDDCPESHGGKVRNRYDASPIHLLTTASLEQLETLGAEQAISARRFRPTILMRTNCGPGFLESPWIGRDIAAGSVELHATEEAKRCGMTMIAQPDIVEEPEVLRTIVRHNRRNLGIYCAVTAPGTIAVGDRVALG